MPTSYDIFLASITDDRDMAGQGRPGVLRQGLGRGATPQEKITSAKKHTYIYKKYFLILVDQVCCLYSGIAQIN
jgi:hypothetical protein